jgi:hypothetical protein
MLNWKVSRKDRLLIDGIVDRAMNALIEIGINADREDVAMDIVCVHNNIYRLRLADWLAADDFNFLHDLYGIRNCLNRVTGKFVGLFHPRFSEGRTR